MNIKVEQVTRNIKVNVTTQNVIVRQQTSNIQVNQVGRRGPEGLQGDSATVEVGTVTTGAPGTPVIVTNSGTENDAVLNFTIPEGQKGDGSSTDWGGILGDIVDQTDLQEQFDTKYDASNPDNYINASGAPVQSVQGRSGAVVITKSDVGLSSVPNLDTTTSVSQTHAHANKALLDTYNQTNANLTTAVSQSHTHSNKSILDATTASFTSSDESKLDGIASGAEVNVNADWNAGSGDAQILNKPTIPTLPANIVQSVTAGTNVTVDNTDPENPVISASGGGEGGAVDSVNGQTGVVVLDASDVGADASGSAATAESNANDYTDSSIAAIDYPVDSVNGQTNTVVLDTDDIDDTATNRYTNDSDIARLANTSGTNTGDQDLSGLVPNTRTVNGAALSSNVTLNQDDIGDGTTYKQYSSTEKTKLSGIATGATANDTDANLKNRANHTGTQIASTISDFDTEVSNNTDVSANTSARHTHSNISVLNATTASFLTADETKLDGIEANADVTDTINVTAAGALMDSEVTNLAAVKAFDPTDYATAAQGVLADSAVQDLSDLSITATASELNVLDGITASTIELNYTDGVTSNIQTQLSTKAAGAASSIDNAIARFDSTTGKIIQNSVVTIGDTGNTIFGTNSDSGTTAPLNVSFGGTYGTNTFGDPGNLKWDMYNDGAGNRYGIGMSGGVMEYQAGAGGSHAFFTNQGSLALYIDSATTAVRVTAPSTLADAVTVNTGTQTLIGKTLNGVILGIATKTANYTLVSTDNTILADATSGDITMTLPAAASHSGRVYTVKKINASNNVIIDANSSETIDGTTTKTLSGQWDSLTFQSNGTNWFII